MILNGKHNLDALLSMGAAYASYDGKTDTTEVTPDVDMSAYGAALLTQAMASKVAEIERARDAACNANVTALGRTWQADERSQKLLGRAITLAQAGLPLPPVWRDFDNNDMPVNSLADLLAIAGAMAQATQAAYSKSWTLKAQVEQAQTVAEVEAVVW